MGISYHIHLTFACIILFVIPFKIHFAHILWSLCQLYIFVGIFVQPLCIGHIIIGLYWAARETGQFQVPMPKAQDKKLKAPNTTIIGITAMRHVPEHASSMTYGCHPERLLTYTLFHHTTRHKGNPDIINKARNYDTHYLHCGLPC